MSATTPSSRGLSVVLSVLGTFIGFAVVTVLLQKGVGGKPSDPGSAERLLKKQTVAAEQAALVEKYGLNASGDLFTKASDQIKARKVSTSTAVVPGSPTALKQAAAAPAPAPTSPAPVPTTPAPPTSPK